MMKAIVAMDEKGGIGSKGKLLFKIHDDMVRFRELTEYNTVIMGRKTLESLPGKVPLTNRLNIVMTRDHTWKPEVAYPMIICHNVGEVISDVLPMLGTSDTFVIGGGEIYHAFLPLCDTIYMTQVNKTFEEADTFFPRLNHRWVCKEEDVSDYLWDSDSQLRFRFLTYRREFKG